jgi:hypothetical protein
VPNNPIDGDVTIDRSHDLYRRPAPPHAPEPAPPSESVLRPGPALPDISAYWPDQAPAQEQRSPFFYRRSEAAPPAARPVSAGPGGRPRRSGRRPVVIGLVLGLLLVAGAGATAVTLLRSDSADTPAAQTERNAPVAPPAPPAQAVPAAPGTGTLTAPVNGRKQVSFELVNGTSRMNLRSAALGSVLYQISTPAGSAVKPRADDLGKKVRLFVRPSGAEGPGTLTVVLNASVRWDLLITGGTERSTLDLSAGGLRRLDLAGGAARIDLTLPRPDGALTVRMTGGVRDFEVRAPGSSVRVRARDGAGLVVVDGRTRAGVARNTSITPARWAGNPHRIDLDAVAGMGTLTVRTRPGR